MLELERWLSILYLHLLRCPATIEVASGKLLPSDLAEFCFGYESMGYLWHYSEEYYVANGEPIPMHYMIERVEELAREMLMTDEELDMISKLLAWAYRVPKDQIKPDESVKHLKKVLRETKLDGPMREALQTGAALDDVRKTFDAGLDLATVSQVEHIDPLANIESLLGTIKVDPIGSAMYFNLLVGGGLSAGEIVVMMGPQGGFKTSIAIDLVCSMAQLKQHSAFYAYEQAYKTGDLPLRFLARLSGVPKDEFMGVNWNDIPEDTKKIIAEAKKTSGYVKVMDRTQHLDYVTDIASHVNDMINRGKKPELIVIDQLQTWISKWDGVDDKTRTNIMKDTILHLKRQVCEKYETRMIVLHQVTAAAIGSKRKFHANESADCKSIGFWPDFVITIGTEDKENHIVTMLADKTRRGETTERRVLTDGARCMFKEAKGWKEDTSRMGGGYVKEDEENKVPTQGAGKVKPTGKKFFTNQAM